MAHLVHGFGRALFTIINGICPVVNRREVRENTPQVVEKCTSQFTDCLEGCIASFQCLLPESVVSWESMLDYWVPEAVGPETVAVKEETGDRGGGRLKSCWCLNQVN